MPIELVTMNVPDHDCTSPEMLQQEHRADLIMSRPQRLSTANFDGTNHNHRVNEIIAGAWLATTDTRLDKSECSIEVALR